MIQKCHDNLFYPDVKLMKNDCGLYWIGVCLLLGMGCAGSAQQRVLTGSGTAREEFDPYTLNDDDFLLQPVALPAAPVPSPTAPSALSVQTPSRQLDGYRIQVSAVIDRGRADLLQQRIQRELQTPTYVIFDEDTHLYKVQAGDCRTPAEAEQLRDAIKARGFQEAYVVRTLIDIADVQVHRPQVAQGYRVQIFSTATRQAAEEARDRAQRQFGRDDILIDFEPPYFRVRVGNFKTRSEAETFQVQATKQGYDAPFVVQMPIPLSPR